MARYGCSQEGIDGLMNLKKVIEEQRKGLADDCAMLKKILDNEGSENNIGFHFHNDLYWRWKEISPEIANKCNNNLENLSGKLKSLIEEIRKIVNQGLS